jgi:hypothetical protein
MEVTREHAGLRRFPGSTVRVRSDNVGRKWYLQLRARGVTHDAVGQLALVALPVTWLWHVTRYPGQWYLDIRPNKGDWPPGVVFPDYTVGYFSSQLSGLEAMQHLLSDLEAGAWPTDPLMDQHRPGQAPNILS